MAIDTSQTEDTSRAVARQVEAYDQWIRSIGIPVHKGYFQDDLRTVEVGEWAERGCKAAIIQLAGQEGVTEGRVTEIAPGQTLPPVRFALDECVYVLDGRGLATVWASDNSPKRTFEWQKHSLFMLPRNYSYQLSNVSGNAPARLLHYNALPTAMALVPDPNFFFNNPYVDESILSGEDFYSEAKVTTSNSVRASGRSGEGTSSRTCGPGTAWCPSRGAGRVATWCGSNIRTPR